MVCKSVMGTMDQADMGMPTEASHAVVMGMERPSHSSTATVTEASHAVMDTVQVNFVNSVNSVNSNGIRSRVILMF